jgi:hypothetical protein
VQLEGLLEVEEVQLVLEAVVAEDLQQFLHRH